jgi:hypothetical protein
VPDLLDHIRQQLGARRDELRPFVEEHHRLEAALLALGEIAREPAAPAPAAAPAQASPRTSKATAAPPKRARRGANREAVLRAVEERPGGTSAELSAVSGVARNTLNGLLARLVKNGELQTRDLPTGRTGYALAVKQR